MKQEKSYYKRYTVQLDCHIVAAFDTIEEAAEWVWDHWWISMATIYDLEQQRLIDTFVRI